MVLRSTSISGYSGTMESLSYDDVEATRKTSVSLPTSIMKWWRDSAFDAQVSMAVYLAAALIVASERRTEVDRLVDELRAKSLAQIERAIADPSGRAQRERPTRKAG